MNEKPILTGFAASQGVAEGRVKVVLDPHKIPTFKEGDILVAKVTEPSMIVIMNKAAAFVTDIGGITSHAAIIAREIGLPCVTDTKNATRLLKDRMRVRVDGTKGEVYRL
ncbi:MAG: PEP-utilizing enzyme [Patescibacteria group bacterium]